MTEIGEKVSVTPEKPAKPEKGDVKVLVKDVCTGDPIENAEVVLGKSTQNSNGQGEASFNGLGVGAENLRVKMHFKDADYSTFIVHYPKILRDHEAKSTDTDVVIVEADKEARVEFLLAVYKTVGDIVFHRRHIDIGGADKYGHWWTVLDAGTSYGWWPKYPMGDDRHRRSQPPQPPAALPADSSIAQSIQHKFDTAVYAVKKKAYDMAESGLARTFRGVEGELNGQTSFGGTATMDPHHLQGDSGDEQYQPVRWDCFDLGVIRAGIKSFAGTYSGGWSWRLEGGNHCHTFQKKLMARYGLANVKVLK